VRLTFLEGNCYIFWSGDTDRCAAGIAGAEPQHHIKEVLLWMVVIEVVWAVYFVVTERWHDKLARKAMLTV
jgi:hypothetical protein